MITVVTVVIPDGPAVTSPVVASMAATVGLLLVHIPPGVASLSVVVPPSQTVESPVITDGSPNTVITTDAEHPVGNV